MELVLLGVLPSSNGDNSLLTNHTLMKIENMVHLEREKELDYFYIALQANQKVNLSTAYSTATHMMDVYSEEIIFTRLLILLILKISFYY